MTLNLFNGHLKPMSEFYTNKVISFCKRGDDIIKGMTPYSAHTLHMAVGLIGELSELIAAFVARDRENLLEEAGDVEFYWNALAYGEGISNGSVILLTEDDRINNGNFQCFDMLFVMAGDILDLAKKEAIYGKKTDNSEMQEVLALFNYWWRIFLGRNSIDRDEIRALNIQKLEKRYPNGYTNSAAQQRADKE